MSSFGSGSNQLLLRFDLLGWSLFLLLHSLGLRNNWLRGELPHLLGNMLSSHRIQLRHHVIVVQDLSEEFLVRLLPLQLVLVLCVQVFEHFVGHHLLQLRHDVLALLGSLVEGDVSLR